MIIWLASYPKSGNTWLRYFILSLINKKEVNLNEMGNIPVFPHTRFFKKLINKKDISEIASKWIEAQKFLNRDNKIKFLKTHNMFMTYKNYSFTDRENTLGGIYVVRDPRNVVCSIKNFYDFESFDKASELLLSEKSVISPQGERGGLDAIISSWQNHYNSWKNMSKNYLLVKYESLLTNPFEEFSKVSNYISYHLKMNFSEKEIKEAIKKSSFENLQKLEKKFGFSEASLNKKKEKITFFQSGPGQNWRKKLNKNLIIRIEEKFKIEMKELGYL